MHDRTLSAAQKRALFREYFGEMLTKAGFVWCRDRFVRVHPGEILLSAGMDVGRRGFAFPSFGAVPFCAGETEWNYRWGERIESFIPFGGKRSAYLYSGFEEQMEIQYRLFSETLFSPFCALTDVRSLKDYWQYHLTPALGYADHEMLVCVCIQTEDWPGAREHLLALIANYDETIRCHRENEQAELRLADSEARRERVRALCTELCEAVAAHRDRLRLDVERIDRGDFEPLRERIAQNVATSETAARKNFPRAWRKR